MKVKELLMGRMIGLMAAVLAMFLTDRCWAENLSLQNFEEGNGTKGDIYFSDVWQGAPDFETARIHSGHRAVRMMCPDKGGAVSVYFSNKRETIDLSKVKTISVWVYDTQGDNSVELRLKDANGNGGSGPDGKFLWSGDTAQKDKWTKVHWKLSDYPAVDGLDLAHIRTVELFEYNSGTYYFDDLEAE